MIWIIDDHLDWKWYLMVNSIEWNNWWSFRLKVIFDNQLDFKVIYFMINLIQWYFLKSIRLNVLLNDQFDRVKYFMINAIDWNILWSTMIECHCCCCRLTRLGEVFNDQLDWVKPNDLKFFIHTQNIFFRFNRIGWISPNSPNSWIYNFSWIIKTTRIETVLIKINILLSLFLIFFIFLLIN